MACHFTRSLAVAVAALGGTLALVAPAAGDIVYARRGKLVTEVVIRGKFPNTQFRLYQSGLEGGGGAYTATNHIITTGPGNGEETGVGRITIKHNGGGDPIHVGHHLMLGPVPGTQPNDQHPNGVRIQDPTYPDYRPGINGGGAPIIVPQSFGGPGEEGVLLETWEAGAFYSLNVDPQQASFVNQGCSVTGEGDLQAHVVSVSPQSVVFMVMGDATPFPPNNILITGLGVNVVAPCDTPVMLSVGMMGTSHIYFNGVLRTTVNNLPPFPPQPFPFAKVMVRGRADVGGVGGQVGGDGARDNNDFVVFIDLFFAGDPRADLGQTGGVPGADGQFNNNDFVAFIDAFFAAGC